MITAGEGKMKGGGERDEGSSRGTLTMQDCGKDGDAGGRMPQQLWFSLASSSPSSLGSLQFQCLFFVVRMEVGGGR